MKKRRNHDAGYTARVALEAVKGERMVSELAAEYGVQPRNTGDISLSRLSGGEPGGRGGCCAR